MNDIIKLPENLTPLNIRAYLINVFGICGCSELAPVISTIVDLLNWNCAKISERQPYEILFSNNVGVFYIISGLFDNLGLSEHGISIRCSWLTDNGKRFLTALKSTSIEDIESATGKAYDDLFYQ